MLNLHTKKEMDNYSIWLWCAAAAVIIITLLFIRIKINLAFYLDILNVGLCGDLKIYGIRILSGRILVDNDKVFILTNKGKRVSVDRLLIEKGKKSSGMLGAVKLKKCDIYGDFGGGGNMFALAFAGAAVNAFSGILYSSGSKFGVYSSCAVGEPKAQFMTEIACSTSVYDLLSAYIADKKKNKSKE